MHVNVRARLLAGALTAFALTAWACTNTTDRDAATRGAGGTSANEPAAVALTGCLQQTGGLTGDYILTQVNSTDRTVGTSGSTAGGNVVEREQQQAAAKSYRLDGDNDQLRDLVGKQVRVNGRITDQADLGKPAPAPASRDTAGNPPASYPERDISASDLARVKVDSITKVSDSCGNGAGK